MLGRTTLVTGRYIEVREERVRLANGHEIDAFHVVETPAWVGVLPITQAGEAVLVRQYRHGIAAESLELPAGVIEAGEEPLDAARRELREETGYAAERWELLATLAPEPARHTVRAHFYVALDATPAGDLAPDASEEIEVVRIPIGELSKHVDSGAIVHGVHVGAILLAERRGLLTRP